MPAPLRLVVLASGHGSNLEALLEAIGAERCAARVAAVVSDRPRAPALGLAEDRGIPTRVVRPRDHGDRPTWDAALAAAIGEHGPDLVVLAGFMRLVGAPVLARFGGRLVNVHPSLLPAFPGLDAPAQAIRAGVRLSGCTVHLVDDGVDTGPILAQAAVPVHPDDDPASLHARIQRLEHRLLPAVVDAVATGRIDPGPPPRPVAPFDPDAAGLVSPPWLLDGVPR